VFEAIKGTFCLSMAHFNFNYIISTPHRFTAQCIRLL